LRIETVVAVPLNREEIEMRHRPKRARRVEAQAAGLNVQCKAEPGVFRPAVDARRCEGTGDCVVVCPYDVFVVGRLADEAFTAMPMLLKMKLWAHGRQTAYTPNADACHACGRCVSACPERAIRLVRNVADRDGAQSRSFA